MKKHSIICLILSIVAFLTLQAQAQNTLPGHIQWQQGCDSIFVFEITYKEALKFLKEGGSDKLMPQLLYNHVATFKNKWENAPQKGHFIYASITENKISYTYMPIIPFQVFLFREYGILALQVIDAQGEVRKDAKVKIQNGKWRFFDQQISYDAQSKVYRTDDWSENPKRILTVEYDKYTAIFDLTKNIVYPSYGSSYWNSTANSGPDFYSYMITDKNKYKPGENVRFKSYALTGRKRPIKENLELWMQKSDNYDFKRITEIEAYNPGGFAGEVALHDSLNLRLDRMYALQLRDKKGRIISHTSFRYEDYELYDNRIETKLKDFTQYYPNQNEVEIKVVDANNLIMPDMKAHITIARGDIGNSYVDLLIVPQVIKMDSINLNNDSPTTYKIPASLFEQTDCTYKVYIDVLTPDGQQLSQWHNVAFYKSFYDVDYAIKDSTLIFSFSELGIDKNVPAKLSIDGSEPVDIVLPHTETYKQNIKNYTITVPEYGKYKNIQTRSIDHGLNVKGGLVKDLLELQLINPLGLDVTWYIYEGNMLLEKGSGKNIDFKKPYIDLDVTYFLEVFFTVGGEDQVYRRVFTPKKEFLNIEWNMPERIFPGQTVDSRIKITDSRGRNVKGVDLTAVAYNSLLNYHIPDLPYYGNTPKGREQRDSYDIENKYANYREMLTQKNYDFWNRIAHLDLNSYYRFTFPDPDLHKRLVDSPSYVQENIPYHDIFKYTIDTPDGTTEFAPYLMQDGQAVNIYAIEVDNTPVYFSWTGQPKGYSFLVNSRSYHKISLRLHDRIIIINGYCLDHGKKTILSINLNKMPQSSHIRSILMSPSKKGTTKEPNWIYEFDKSEKTLYSKYISVVPIIKDRFTYMTQQVLKDTIVIPISHPLFEYNRNTYQSPKSHQTVGPLNEGMYRYMDGVEYHHEGGFIHKYADNVVYKYPIKPYPTSLEHSTKNNFDNLNDFHFTAKEFGRKVGLVATVENKWYPGVINLANTKIHIPIDSQKSGLRGIIMLSRQTGKQFVPVFNQNIFGNYGNKELFGIKNMHYGNYDVFALFNNGNYLRYNNVPLLEGNYVELKMNKCEEQPKDSTSIKWLQYTPPAYAVSSNGSIGRSGTSTQQYANIGKLYFNPANDVRGVVKDEEGNELPGVSISLKGKPAGTLTDIDGKFILDLHGAENILVFSYIGSKTQEVAVTRGSNITVVMQDDTQMLMETVVVGYGTVKRSSMTGAISSVSGNAAAAIIEEDEISESTVSDKVEDDGSAKLYAELLQLDGMRSNFSDVGFWEPKLVTDRRGEASFTVTFPDNITQWESVVFAMNRKLKTGTLRRSINSYKPLMAEIKTPQFLVAGDSSLFSTNIRNYTNDKEIKGEILFVNNGDSIFRTPIRFESSYQKYIPVIAPAEQDSLTFSYRFTRNDGYSDGEQRSISIEKQGVEVAEGVLQFLRNGDHIDVATTTDEEVEISISSKQIDVYMDAANYLMGYKYACNEQLASKLIGLLNFRLYKQFKEEPFKYDKNINEIINRLLKNQNENKLWSWWSNDKNTSYWMSAHILRALNMAYKAGYRVDLDIKQVQYDYVDIHRFRSTSLSDIDVLNALVDWGTEQSYEEIIELFEDKIKKIEVYEDLLVEKYKKTKAPKDRFIRRHSYLTQKLILMEMRQKLGLKYDNKLILNHLNEDVYRAVSIKDTLPTQWWYYNNDAANVVAYRIARNDSILKQYVDGMQMHILGTKRYGWNTYQSSSALMTILPDLLAESTTANNLATVVVAGKENGSIKKFPYYTTVKEGEQLSITKESGIPLLYSAYTMKRRTEKHFGEAFDITTSIDSKTLEKGVPVTMVVHVKVKQDNAEHVIIEIPVPAGCSYENKNLGYGRHEVYREYFKEKVAIFCETLPKGEYRYTINLLPRYSGQYILNPAKVEMMYFPVINSNNDMRKLDIQ